MGGLYSLTAAAVQGLSAKIWGTQVPVEYSQDQTTGAITPVEGGRTLDTGVQEMVQGLIARLSSETPIQMPNSLTLIAPPNAPAIQIINNAGDTLINIGGGDGGGGDGGGNVTNNNITNNTFQNIINFLTNVQTDPNNLNLNVDIPVVTGVSGTGNVSVSGCTATLSISLSVTTSTIIIRGGAFQGVS